MKRFLCLLTLWLSVLAGVTHANTEQSVPPIGSGVVDTTHWLSSQEVLALEKEIRTAHEATGAQIAVLIVDTVVPEEIAQFSLRVAETWKVGKKGVDNGVLIVIARSDHKFRMDVGYGLEGRLPDLKVKHLLDSYMVPRFKENKPYNAVHAVIDALKVELSKEPGAKEKQPATKVESDDEPFAIPLFEDLNGAGQAVALICGIIGGILLLIGVNGESGLAILGGIGVPLGVGLLLGLLVNFTMCLMVALVALIIAIMIALGLTIGTVAVGGLFGGGGASSDW